MLIVKAVLFCLFVWWFSTGAIIFLDGMPRKTFKYSMAASTLLTLMALFGLAATAHSTTVSGAYIAFTCGVFAWGWQEISFYMGYVTGPRRSPCPENCSGWRHFLHAVQTSLWHELAIIASACIVVALTWHAPNQIGTWTFMVLWWMHQSAKLNVFLGVRNLNEEFLPDHLAFLKSFLTKKPMNLLFPVSVTVSTVLCTMLVQHASAAGTGSFSRVGFTFLATMMSFAILEHWFLVLPLPAAALWRWGLASRGAPASVRVQIVAGFLGAGKTTFMRRLLSGPAEGRTVVLVNDFAAVGIDGSLLSRQGAEVVELPNGCICCSLKADLARQLNDVVAKHAPRRVLIEPSGVADLASLVRALHAPNVAPLIEDLDIVTLIDSGSFLADFARMEAHLRAQILPANRIIINKADIVSTAGLRTVANTVRTIAPGADIVAARFGVIDKTAALETVQPLRSADIVELAAPRRSAAPSHDHDHHHHHETLQLASWSSDLPESCDPDRVQYVMDRAAAGQFGSVERLKGLARAGKGWIRFDIAGGRASMEAFAPGCQEIARVVAIGRDIDEQALNAAFKECAMGEAAA